MIRVLFLVLAFFVVAACNAAPLSRHDRDAEAEALSIRFVTSLLVEKETAKAVDLTDAPFVKVGPTRESFAAHLLTTPDEIRYCLQKTSFSRDMKISGRASVALYDDQVRETFALFGNDFVDVFDAVLYKGGRVVSVPLRLDGFRLTALVLVGQSNREARVVGCWNILSRD